MDAKLFSYGLLISWLMHASITCSRARAVNCCYGHSVACSRDGRLLTHAVTMMVAVLHGQLLGRSDGQLVGRLAGRLVCRLDGYALHTSQSR